MSNTTTGQQIGTIGTGVRISKVVTDTSPAALNQTGQPLDFGIAGTRCFALRTAQGIHYTRDGQFQSNASNQLADGHGNSSWARTASP